VKNVKMMFDHTVSALFFISASLVLFFIFIIIFLGPVSIVFTPIYDGKFDYYLAVLAVTGVIKLRRYVQNL
jgi:hypothetical protein